MAAVEALHLTHLQLSVLLRLLGPMKIIDPDTGKETRSLYPVMFEGLAEMLANISGPYIQYVKLVCWGMESPPFHEEHHWKRVMCDGESRLEVCSRTDGVKEWERLVGSG